MHFQIVQMPRRGRHCIFGKLKKRIKTKIDAIYQGTLICGHVTIISLDTMITPSMQCPLKLKGSRYYDYEHVCYLFYNHNQVKQR